MAHRRGALSVGVLALSLAACGGDTTRVQGHQAVDLTKFISHDVTTDTPGPSASGCGTTTSDGECSGDVYSYCSSGKLISRDCTLAQQICSIDSSGVAGCADIGSSGGCGSVSSQGICQGSVILYCDAGTLQMFDCFDIGSDCYEDSFGANCF